MRRRSERSKAVTSSPEKSTTRKSTRRNIRSNSRSDVDKPTDDENEMSVADSSPERESPPVKSRRKLSRQTKNDDADEKTVTRTTRRGRKSAASIAAAAAAAEMDPVIEEKEPTDANGDSDTEKVVTVDTPIESTDEPTAIVEDEKSTDPEPEPEPEALPASDEIETVRNNNKETVEPDAVEEKEEETQPEQKEDQKNDETSTDNVQIAETSKSDRDEDDSADRNKTSEKDKHKESNEVFSPSNNRRSNYHSDRRRSTKSSSASTSSSSASSDEEEQRKKQSSNSIEIERSESSSSRSPAKSPFTEAAVEIESVPKQRKISKPDPETEIEREKSPEVVTEAPPPTMTKVTRSHHPVAMETDEHQTADSNDKQDKDQDSVAAAAAAEKPKRKRRWLSQKSTEPKQQILAISTDSLRNIIADVKPVPLSDVKLEPSPEPELITIPDADDKSNDRRTKDNKVRRSNDSIGIATAAATSSITTTTTETSALEQTSSGMAAASAAAATGAASISASTSSSEKLSAHGTITVNEINPLGTNRKISIVHDGPMKIQRPPSPSKNNSTNILFITNLVRPFTVPQLKGLLARTGKICENGFWIDKIKSKCYVKYETEDEAVETRHALHGVRWPASNPKCLNVDFGTVSAMGKAIASTSDEVPSKDGHNVREERTAGGWDRYEVVDERREPATNRPVREWDLGKKDDLQRERERDRERITKEHDRGERGDGVKDGKERERSSHRGKDPGRSSDRRQRRSTDRTKRSASITSADKYQRKENEPPIRLLDDLFRKTKTTPCIYWLPLTTEQIAVREEARRKHLAEHKRRMEEASQRSEMRERERDREREQRQEERNAKERRERSSDDKRKDSSSRTSKTRDGTDKDNRDQRERDRNRRRY